LYGRDVITVVTAIIVVVLATAAAASTSYTYVWIVLRPVAVHARNQGIGAGGRHPSVGKMVRFRR